MFGIKKQQRIRLANPNYWMIDEYHQHENEGRKTMMTKEDVQKKREGRYCGACYFATMNRDDDPCSACRKNTGAPGWVPSGIFSALEEALTDKPVEAKAMTAEEIELNLKRMRVHFVEDARANRSNLDLVNIDAIQYAIDAIRRDSKVKKIRELELHCPKCGNVMTLILRDDHA